MAATDSRFPYARAHRLRISRVIAARSIGDCTIMADRLLNKARPRGQLQQFAPQYRGAERAWASTSDHARFGSLSKLRSQDHVASATLVMSVGVGGHIAANDQRGEKADATKHRWSLSATGAKSRPNTDPTMRTSGSMPDRDDAPWLANQITPM